MVPITRSQIEFARGLAKGARNTFKPSAFIESSSAFEKMLSRLWIKYECVSASHAVLDNDYINRNVTVTATKKSQARIAFA